MSDLLNYHDLRRAAQKRLPRGIFEYIDRGSEDEVALRHHRTTFEATKIIPRVLQDGPVSLGKRLFGQDWDLPLIAAPTAFTGLVWFRGELSLARAADQAGIPYCAATMGITSVEEIARQSERGAWFQLYLWQQADLWRDLVARAAAAGVKTLVLTVDTNVSPNREFNARNGFGMPFRFRPRAVWDVARHPHWLTQVLLRYLVEDGWPELANYPQPHRPDILSRQSGAPLHHHPDLSWDHVRALRDLWKGNLVIKGILHPEDAVRAADLGADGIVVSSHGARNIDSVVAPVSVLPDIAAAVGSRLTVLADSGVQRGSDVFKLLQAGARGVMVGRAFLYGTAVGGETGATRAIDILRDELRRTMILSGCRQVSQLGQAGG